MPDTFTIIGTIRFAPDHIAELQDGRAIAKVPRDQIRSITLRHGLLARSPMLQFVFGVLLTLVSSIVALVPFITGHGLTRLALAGGFIPLGLWVMLESFKRGHYLEIWTVSSRRKLACGKTLSPEDQEKIQQLLR